MNNIPVRIKIGIAAITALLCATACSPLNEPAQTVMTEIAASTESAVHASSEASASESESSSSLSSYISEVSSSESSQTETSETSSEDISSSSDVEATVKAEEIRAAEKAKQEEELRIQQAEQEKARQEAEAALKAEQEKAAASQGSSNSQGSSSSSQAEKPSTPAEKPADSQTSEEPTQSEPQSVAQQSGKYALNEYGNPSVDVLQTRVKVDVNPADPALQKALGGRGTQDPNVRIPNPWSSAQPISPYIGQANPPAAWPKPTPRGAGEYKWSPEAGCWRYYSGGKAYNKYVSIYGRETWAQSYLEKSNPGASVLKPQSVAHAMGIYGV